MPQAVIYARFSDRPNAKNCESIAVQLDRCRAYCEAKCLDVDSEHADEAVSGASVNGRPGLEAALRRACALRKNGAFMVYSLSRAARSTRDAIAIADRLGSAGAEFISLHESIDTSTSGGRFFFTVMAALAQFEREQTAERTSDAMLALQANGRRMSARPPFGWRIDPHSPLSTKPHHKPTGLMPDPAEQAVLARILEMNAEGNGVRRIARTLMDEGVTFREKTMWHPKTISRILEHASR